MKAFEIYFYNIKIKYSRFNFNILQVFLKILILNFVNLQVNMYFSILCKAFQRFNKLY